MPEPEYSSKQVGIIGQYEPELCAVSGRPVRGKHAVTHYKGDNVHYVRVLNQFDHRWPEAATRYGFPVTEEKPAQDENVFVLEGLDEPLQNITLTTDTTPDQMVKGLQQVGLVSPDRAPRAPKPASNTQSDIKADGMSKGDD